MSKCKNKACGKELVQSPGKRKKEYCNSTCRSNSWQHKDRKKKKAATKVAGKPVVLEDVKSAGSKKNSGFAKVVPAKRNILKDALNPLAPNTLKELKAMCPSTLSGLERSKWISENRTKYNV